LYRWTDESESESESESERVEAHEDGRLVTVENARESRLRRAKRAAQGRAGRQDIRSGFFQKRLAESQGSTPQEQRRWRAGIYDYVRDVVSLQGSLTIERMCQLAGVSKAGFYRYLRSRDLHEEEMCVRSAHAA
jgi:hypothetical protein